MDEEILNNLKKIGLNAQESKVYLGLLKIGESKTGKLSEYTGVPTSHIYGVLDSLFKQGLISYKIANNVKVYFANKPETLKVLYVEKQEELAKEEKLLLESIQTLKQLPKSKETFSDYKYFEGVSGVKSLWLEMMEDLPANSNISIFSSKEQSIKQFNAVFMEFHRTRLKKNIKQRLIFPKSTAIDYSKERADVGLIDIRYIDLYPDTEFTVTDDFVIIQFLGSGEEMPRAFYIKDKLFAQYFKMIFDTYWALAKK